MHPTYLRRRLLGSTTTAIAIFLSRNGVEGGRRSKRTKALRSDSGARNEEL